MSKIKMVKLTDEEMEILEEFESKNGDMEQLKVAMLEVHQSRIELAAAIDELQDSLKAASH